MKTRDWLIAFCVITAAALLANLLALKIASDQVQAKLNESSSNNALLSLLRN